MCALRVNANGRPDGWLCTASLDKPAVSVGTAGEHKWRRLRRQSISSRWWRCSARRRRGADLQARGLGSVLGYLAAGLRHRPVRARAVHRPAGDPARRRARRRHVPVRHRPGDAAVAAVEPAARDLRAGRRAGGRLRRAADRRRHAGRLCAAGRLRRRHGLRAVLDRHRHADAGRARRDRDAARASAPSRSCCSRIWRSCRCWRWSPSCAPGAAETDAPVALDGDRHRARPPSRR